MGNKEPYKSKHMEYFSYEKKLLSLLRDARCDFCSIQGIIKRQILKKICMIY